MVTTMSPSSYLREGESFMLHIDVWADITCPWCYLNLRHLRAALSEFPHKEDITVRINSFFLHPDLEHTWDESHAMFMSTTYGMEIPEVLATYERLEKIGKAEGIRFNFDRLVVAPSHNAHALLAYAAEYDLLSDAATGADTHHIRLYEAIARAHFDLNLNINDPEVLVGCAQDVGLPPREALDALQGSDYHHHALADYQMALSMGITAVPTMLINQRFVIPGMQTQTAVCNMLGTAWKDANEGDTP